MVQEVPYSRKIMFCAIIISESKCDGCGGKEGRIVAGNSNLHDSARNKQDEFYTQLSLIENELKYYREHFKGKVVFCNCDDPFESNFFKYFAMNFNALGLKKLIATCYCLSPVFSTEIDLFDPESEKKIIPGKKKAVQFRIVEIPDMNCDGAISLEDAELLIKNRRPYRVLKGDKKYSAGDFRSNECVELLKEADVVVTNPPFSLFREYVTQLVEYGKEFLILGNLNAVTYKEILPLVMNNKVWIGYNSGHYWFKVPSTYEEKKTDFKTDENGQKWRRMGNICWFTNMDIEKRHENMTLFRTYSPDAYPKYDNYDAIDVSKTADIPCDYFEAVGVPVTYLTKFNPEQFELLGIDKDFTSDGGRFLVNDNNSRGGGYDVYTLVSLFAAGNNGTSIRKI